MPLSTIAMPTSWALLTPNMNVRPPAWKFIPHSRRVDETPGSRTPRYLAKATATAASVPHWITKNRVHP